MRVLVRTETAVRTLAGAAAAAALLVATVAAATPSDRQIAEAADTVLDDSYQTNLPAAEAPVDPANVRPFVLPLPPVWFAIIIRWLLIALAVAAVALLATWVVQKTQEARRSIAVADESKTPDESSSVDRRLADAQALAARGHFAEAVHALLLHALDRLHRSASTPIPDAYTSREIIARVSLPDTARGALHDLVNAVETFHFGYAAAGESDYLSCLERYQTFSSEHAGGSA